jgi:lipopolysaccharide export system protein LptA
MRGRVVLRWALAIFAIGFAVWLAILLRQNRRDDVASADPRTDPNAIVESSGGLITRTRGDQRDFDIQHQGLLTYPDGRTTFKQVVVTVPERDDRRGFVLSGDQGEVAGDGERVLFTGSLRLETSDGLTMTGPEASYDAADGVVRVTGDVAFEKARMRGQSVGATYDNVRDVLWLLEQARIDVTPDAQGQGAVAMRAGSAGFARAERYIRLQEGAEVSRDGQTLAGDTVTVFLQAAGDVIELVELRGNSSVRMPAPQSLEAMTASDINLAYAEDGRTLRQAVLAEQARVQFRGTSGPGRRLAAQLIDMQLDADGSTLTGLAARDAVELSLPASGGTPARVITATTLNGVGTAGRGITGATFGESVVFTESRAAGPKITALNRTVSADTLDLITAGNLDEIERATFAGTVTVRDDGRTATAPRMVYRTGSGDITLTAEGTTQFARVDDAAGSVQARVVNIINDGDDFLAETDVRSVIKGGASGPERPALFEADQPVNVTAAKLERTGPSARYSGDAQIWQGATSIKADTIVLDEQNGNLTATGTVRTVLELEEADAKTGKAQRSMTTGTSDELVYTDKDRQAVFTGKARLVNARDGDLRAVRIEVFLLDDGRQVERLEAYETVSLRTPAKHGTGARLSYFPQDGRYVMSGTPVNVFEQLPNECRETTGRTLTFYRDVDTITVDGNQSTRTQTRTTGKCPPGVG